MGEPTNRGPVGPGMELDGFLIEAVAGRGGMGVVYKARQSRPDRVVALKVIATDLAQDDAFRARFQRESSIAAQIEHPNVIPVYAVGESDGVLYIAMRFVEGTDLRTLLAQEGRLAPHRAAGIVDAVGQALDAAHSHGLVHRDVKPANILISPSTGGRDHVYLSDFGLSRHIEGSGGLTGTGAFLGTIDYVAPEQARGERVDARTDVYSLGCVLFQALTGTVPFPLDNDLAKLYAHDQKSPPSALERAPDLPHPFEAVLARAMAKAPDDRYLSAGDLGRAAIAAASGAVLSRAERSVAVEAAAPEGVGRVGAPATVAAAPATAVSAAAPAAGSAPPRPTGRMSRRGWKVAAALVALAVAAIVMVIVLGEGGHTEGGPISSFSSTTTTSAPANAPATAPQGKFTATTFHTAENVRCRFEAPTLTCRNSSGVTATLTKSGKAKLGKTGEELPAGTTLIKGKGFWEGGEMNCYPKPDGAVSCAAFNGHGFHMGKDEEVGSNPY